MNPRQRGDVCIAAAGAGFGGFWLGTTGCPKRTPSVLHCHGVLALQKCPFLPRISALLSPNHWKALLFCVWHVGVARLLKAGQDRAGQQKRHVNSQRLRKECVSKCFEAWKLRFALDFAFAAGQPNTFYIFPRPLGSAGAGGPIHIPYRVQETKKNVPFRNQIWVAGKSPFFWNVSSN